MFSATSCSFIACVWTKRIFHQSSIRHVLRTVVSSLIMFSKKLSRYCQSDKLIAAISMTILATQLDWNPSWSKWSVRIAYKVKRTSFFFVDLSKLWSYSLLLATIHDELCHLCFIQSNHKARTLLWIDSVSMTVNLFLRWISFIILHKLLGLNDDIIITEAACVSLKNFIFLHCQSIIV